MLTLDNAINYDIETYPNCFTFYMIDHNSDMQAVWEISHFRDDRQQLLEFLRLMAQQQTLMIGYNNNNFDYPVIDFLF